MGQEPIDEALVGPIRIRTRGEGSFYPRCDLQPEWFGVSGVRVAKLR